MIPQDKQTPFISSVWPDGAFIDGDGWVDLEDRLRNRQWSKYGTTAFRKEMQRRALLWAGTRIPVDSAESMFRALESIGMCRLRVEGDDREHRVSAC